jgi:hypothetical protein
VWSRPVPERALPVALPPLPANAAERAELLDRIAAALVAQLGPPAALALAAWLDEAAADAATGDAGWR